MSDEYTQLFVYGTLCTGGKRTRKGEVRDREMATLRGVEKHTVSPPTIAPNPDDEVEGEIMFVDDDALQGLDRYEGVPSLYRRVEVDTWNGDPVYVYVGNPSRLSVPDELYPFARYTTAEVFSDVAEVIVDE